MLDTLVSLVLPLTLFIHSLWLVGRQLRHARPDNIPDIVWTGVIVIINVIALFWGARMVHAVWVHGSVPQQLASHTYSAGFSLFCVLTLVLAARSFGKVQGNK